MPLEQELETFEKMKPELLKKYRDKFALFHGADFVGALDMRKMPTSLACRSSVSRHS